MLCIGVPKIPKKLIQSILEGNYENTELKIEKI